MLKNSSLIAIFVASVVVCSTANALEPSVSFTKPAANAKVTNPVEICLEVAGVELEAAKKGVNAGKGHLHILIDTEVTDPTMPLATDKPDHIVHMGDATKCRTLTLAKGEHKLSGVFTNGAHIPGTPVLSTSIQINVE